MALLATPRVTLHLTSFRPQLFLMSPRRTFPTFPTLWSLNPQVRALPEGRHISTWGPVAPEALPWIFQAGKGAPFYKVQVPNRIVLTCGHREILLSYHLKRATPLSTLPQITSTSQPPTVKAWILLQIRILALVIMRHHQRSNHKELLQAGRPPATPLTNVLMIPSHFLATLNRTSKTFLAAVPVFSARAKTSRTSLHSCTTRLPPMLPMTKINSPAPTLMRPPLAALQTGT